jgi:hypothetical protein
MTFPRLPYMDSRQRGALALGSLLAFVLLVTVAGAFSIYRQLDEAAREQQLLVRAQEQLFAVLRDQYTEETGVHGYVATHAEYFLGNRLEQHDRFDDDVSDLIDSTQRLHLSVLTDAAREMAEYHGQWERNVAEPLSRRPPPKNPEQYQSRGKYLADLIRSDANRLTELLDGRVRDAQRALIWRINATLGIALLAILLFGALGIAFVGSRHRMLGRLERERRIIETLQGAFRTGWDSLPKSRVGTAYVSATRDASVGGDLFDVRRLDEDRGLVIVADISGKGIEAAVNTAFVKYSIRTLALEHDDPGAILGAFNRMFLDTIKDPSLFVVVFVGIFDARTMRFTYGSAGHPGAYLRRGSEVTQLGVTGPIVGLDRSFTYGTQSVALQPRDLLVLATDGLTEARDRQGNTLDDAGAIRLVLESPNEPQACADNLVSAVRRRSGGRVFDDLALLVIGIDAEQRGRSGKSTDAAA